MRVLVIGGAGYIGSHTVYELIKAGHQPYVMDNLSKGHKDLIPEDAVFFEGDLGNESLLKNILTSHKIQAVMHFAAFAYVGESVQHPDQYYDNNVVKTKVLLDAMLQTGVKQIVFSSSCAVYGNPVELPISESHPQNPISPYGRSKKTVEWMLEDYHHAFLLNSVALRYFNASGAHTQYPIGEDHSPETHLIPRCLLTALNHYPEVEIFGNDYPTGDGTCIRDYIHVEDLARAHVLALEYTQKTTGFNAFNLGTSVGYSIMEVIQTAKKISGIKIPFSFKPRRPGDPPELVADEERAEKVLGWKPKFISLESIIESAWTWHTKRHGKK